MKIGSPDGLDSDIDFFRKACYTIHIERTVKRYVQQKYLAVVAQ